MGGALLVWLFQAAAERAAKAADEVALDTFALAVGGELTGDPGAVAAEVSCPVGLELLRSPI